AGEKDDGVVAFEQLGDAARQLLDRRCRLVELAIEVVEQLCDVARVGDARPMNVRGHRCDARARSCATSGLGGFGSSGSRVTSSVEAPRCMRMRAVSTQSGAVFAVGRSPLPTAA